MTKGFKKQIERYNNIIVEANYLRYNIEKELYDKYGISDCNPGFGRDDLFDLFESCSDEFDIKKIEMIIDGITKFRKEFKTDPNYNELKIILDQYDKYDE